MRRQYYILFFCVVLLSSALIWRKPLTCHLAQFCFKQAVERSTGHRLAFDQFVLEKNRIVLSHPSLNDKNRVHEKGGIYLCAQSATLDYDFNFLKKKIKVEIELIDPLIDVVKTAQFQPSLSALFHSKKSRFDVKLGCRTQQGELKLIDKVNPRAACIQEIGFCVDSRLFHENQLAVELCLFQGSSQCKSLINIREKKVDYKLNLDHFALKDAQNMIFFWLTERSQKNRSLNFSNGVVDGSIECRFIPDHLPLIEVDLDMEHIQLDDQKTLLSTYIPKAQAHLKTPLLFKEKRGYLIYEVAEILVDNCQGIIEVPQGAQIVYQKNQVEILKSPNMKGKIVFEDQKPAQFSFEGLITSKNKELELKLEGALYSMTAKGDFNLRLKGPNQEAAHLRCLIDSLGPRQHKLYAQISHFNKEGVEVIQQLLSPFFPNLKEVELIDGTLQAYLRAHFYNFKLDELFIDNFNLTKLHFKSNLKIKEIQGLDANGALSFNFLNSDPMKTLLGQVRFQARHFNAINHPFEQLEGNCQFKDGQLEKSYAKAALGQLFGEAKWKFALDEDPLSIKVQGKGQAFLTHLPNLFQKAYGPEFANSSVELNLNGRLNDDKMTITANCQIGSESLAHFGFDIQKNEEEKTALKPLKEFWSAYLSPNTTSPSLHYFENKLSLNSKSNYKVGHGWFDIKQASVEKFITPIVFAGTTLNLSGYADLSGQFDNHCLAIFYDQYRLQFDHEYVCVQFQSSPGESSQGEHYFSLDQDVNFGKIHLHHANCQVQSSPLNFNHLTGWVEIAPDGIYAQTLGAKIKEIELQTDFQLTFFKEHELDLKLKIKDLKGRLGDFKDLFASLGAPLFNDLPVNGQIEIEPDQGYFHLTKNGDVKTQIYLNGLFKDGFASIANQRPLQKICCQFLLDSDAKIFEIKNFESEWISHRQQKYGLYTDYLKFNFFDDNPCNFDLKIKSSYKDCARFLGKLYLNLSQKKPILKVILDAPENHLGNVNFSRVYFALNESYKLDYLNVNFTTNLGSLHQDITLMQNLMPQMPSHALIAIKKMDFKGQISGQWSYNHGTDRHQFYIWGDQVHCSELGGGLLQVKGFKEKKSIVVEDLVYHDLKGGCKIDQKSFCYYIKDFHLGAEKKFSINLSGVYCKLFNSFQANIDHVFCDMDYIKKWSSLSTLPLMQDIKGNLNLQGRVEGGIFKGDLFYDLKLMGQTLGLKTKEVLFKDDLFQIALEGTSKKLKIKHIESHFLQAYQLPFHADFEGSNLEFARGAPQCKIENLHFALPAGQIGSLCDILESQLKINVPRKSFEIQKEGLLKGELSFNPENQNYTFNINLQQGNYFLFDKPYYLDQCQLCYGPSGVKIAAQSTFNQRPYWFNYQKEGFSPKSFSVAVYDQNPALSPSVGLSVACLEKEGGISIQNIQGSIGGMNLDFIHRPEKDTLDNHVLMGQIQINGQELIDKLPEELSKHLQKIQLGTGYFITGELALPKKSPQQFVFKGLMGGQNFDLLGFEFKNLSSSIVCTPQSIKIHDFKISDLSGELLIEKMQILKKGSDYHLEIPKLILREFKPSLLHRKNEDHIENKPLIIEKFELRDLKGNLLNPNSFTGYGSFNFQKMPKKQASLFDIPVHIINKIGLDLTMLNPVEGQVLYEVKDGKMLFTKFIDVYSHDKHCHFTLAKQSNPSYLDFDGNLNVKIKMKQFVLLKITEPFIISIQGPCWAPQYSFMRKKMVVDVPEKLAE